MQCNIFDDYVYWIAHLSSFQKNYLIKCRWREGNQAKQQNQDVRWGYTVNEIKAASWSGKALRFPY